MWSNERFHGLNDVIYLLLDLIADWQLIMSSCTIGILDISCCHNLRVFSCWKLFGYNNILITLLYSYLAGYQAGLRGLTSEV